MMYCSSYHSNYIFPRRPIQFLISLAKPTSSTLNLIPSDLGYAQWLRTLRSRMVYSTSSLIRPGCLKWSPFCIQNLTMEDRTKLSWRLQKDFWVDLLLLVIKRHCGCHITVKNPLYVCKSHAGPNPASGTSSLRCIISSMFYCWLKGPLLIAVGGD